MAVFCGARLRVAVLCGRGSLAVLGCEFVIWVTGCKWSCWVTGGCFGFWVQRWRDRGERVRDEGKNKGERVDKIFFFFYNTCYSAILCLELHCSSIAKKFAILLVSIPQCRWF